MNSLIGTLVRFAVWMARREAERTREHRREDDTRDCLCDPCQWVCGLEAEADEKLGRRWR